MPRAAWVVALLLACGGCTAEAEAPRTTTTSSPAPRDAEPDVEPDGEGAMGGGTTGEVRTSPFDLTRHSRSDPDSIWVLVDKRRLLRPATHTPELDIVEGYLVHPRVVRPLTRLLAAGRRAGLDLRVLSAYRSYGRQAELYAGAVAGLGPDRAALTTAPAGHSEHQTGLAVDLGRAATGECNVAPCFARTREGRWLRRHAHRFGFIVRYPAGGRGVTGFAHESWHFRFVGPPLARHMRREGIATLEEVFGRGGGGS